VRGPAKPRAMRIRPAGSAPERRLRAAQAKPGSRHLLGAQLEGRIHSPPAESHTNHVHLWRDEAVRAGRTISRIALAFEAGRDGFWLARCLAAGGNRATSYPRWGGVIHNQVKVEKLVCVISFTLIFGPAAHDHNSEKAYR